MKDLIERQVAIEGVKKSCLGVENVVQAEANAIEYIKRMPSAQPERYWIDSEGKISALPSAQPNVYVSTKEADYISRAQALNAINVGGDLEGAWINVAKLPSAQPEKRTDKRAETHACDLISRQEAIDAVSLAYTNTEVVNNRPVNDYERELYIRIRVKLSELPSAQPEIIRCKDCTYFDKYIDCKEMYQWDGFCADWARKTYENWYCSRAERRSDE